MNQSALARAQTSAMSSIGDMPATSRQRSAAAAACTALSLCAVLALLFGSGQGPVIKPLVPIAATVWSLADVITAGLLLSQFYYSGRISFAVLTLAYGMSGVLSWAFLFTFPGLFRGPPATLGDQSTFVYFWMIFHVTFPVLAVIAVRNDLPSKRICSRRAIVWTTGITAALPFLLSGVIAAVVFAERDVLPYLVIGGHLQTADRLAFHPTVVILNVIACFVLLARRERTSTLQLWLCVAMFAACLDSLLVNVTGTTYSYAWDVGKFIAVVTACIVLFVMLTENVGLYGRQLRLNETLEEDLHARERTEVALRASEERFRQVEEHSPIGLALIELDGRFIRVNPALCAITGFGSDDLLARRFQELTHEDDVAGNVSLMQRAIAGSIASYEFEKRYYHKDGHVVWVLANGCVVRDELGEPRYLIVQIQDISARKVAALELERAQNAACAATEAKSQFVATMSHEIRTPMNGIIGMAELLSLSHLSVDQKEYVKVVRDSGRSLMRVVNDILDYSKFEAGKLELEHIAFDLASQIRSVVALIEPQFAAKGVSLSTQVDPSVPAALEGDPGRVRQILINLVGNALKFTPAGGRVTIRASANRKCGAGIPVRLTIEDTGCGIALEERDRLFVPFSQVDPSTTRKYGGTGLGLSICKHLVELMGGEIGVVSTEGRGSSFWFTLPFERGSRSESVLDAPAREKDERRAAVSPRPEKVLIAEDNEINVLLATKQFRHLGLSVTVVTDGREALRAVRTQHFDVIFMDCHMPKMDGFAATRAIRELASEAERRTPIVAMTANAAVEDRKACLAAGMDDYVSKPVSLSDLRSVVERWLPSERQDGAAKYTIRES